MACLEEKTASFSMHSCLQTQLLWNHFLFSLWDCGTTVEVPQWNGDKRGSTYDTWEWWQNVEWMRAGFVGTTGSFSSIHSNYIMDHVQCAVVIDIISPNSKQPFFHWKWFCHRSEHFCRFPGPVFANVDQNTQVLHYLTQMLVPLTNRAIMDDSLTPFTEQPRALLHYHLVLCHDIALAVVYLHTNGLKHLDLSSNNVRGTHSQTGKYLSPGR